LNSRHLKGVERRHTEKSFYQTRGFVLRDGGETASFSSLAAGPCSVNLIARPAEQRWSWWGRVIFYVADVDALYRHALALGLRPDTAPCDAPWGERYFHRTAPDGHELSFARPLGPGSLPDEASASTGGW
jgi:hypothetical protein